MDPKIYTVRLFEAPRAKWRLSGHIKKLPDRSVVATSEPEARQKILLMFVDERRPVYFLFFGLHDRFTCVVGKTATNPPRSGNEEGKEPLWF